MLKQKIKKTKRTRPIWGARCWKPGPATTLSGHFEQPAACRCPRALSHASIHSLTRPGVCGHLRCVGGPVPKRDGYEGHCQGHTLSKHLEGLLRNSRNLLVPNSFPSTSQAWLNPSIFPLLPGVHPSQASTTWVYTRARTSRLVPFQPTPRVEATGIVDHKSDQDITSLISHRPLSTTLASESLPFCSLCLECSSLSPASA